MSTRRRPGSSRRGRSCAGLAPGLIAAAEQSSKPVVFDKKTESWMFANDLLERSIKARHITEEQATDPVGGRLTLAGLARLEKGFTAEKLATAVTRLRLLQMTNAVVQTAWKDKKHLKDGKYVYPAGFLAEAAKAKKRPRRPSKTPGARG